MGFCMIETRERKKYAIVEPIGGHGGNEFYIFGLAQALSLRFIVYVFTCTETRLHRKVDLPCDTFCYFRGIYGVGWAWLRAAAYFISTCRVLLRVVCDRISIVHLHIYHFNVLELLLVLTFRLIPGVDIYLTVHDVESFARFGKPGSHTRHRFLMALADRLFVHTQYASALLNEIAPADAKRKLVVIPSLDLDSVYKGDISMEAAKKKLGLHESFRYILFFGQIKKVKGVDLLLRAIEISQEALRLDSAKVIIAGKVWKDNWNTYAQLISSSGIGDLVLRFGEYIPNELVPVFFAASELVVLPYREIYNSSVLLRSMDYGVPILASSLPVFLEFISEDNGVVFEAGSSESLSGQLTYALMHPEEMRKRSEVAQARIKETNSSSALLKAMFGEGRFSH